MSARVAREIASLKLELARIQGALARNPDWVALQGGGPQPSDSDADGQKARRRHERALAKNPAFLAGKALSRAIALLESVPPVPDADLAPTYGADAPANALVPVRRTRVNTDAAVQSSEHSLIGGSLLRRLREAKPVAEFDGETYAAYRGEVEYAEVEIVHVDGTGKRKA